MEILKLITKYWEYNSKLPLGNSTTVIYYHLLYKWYLNNKKEFSISDIELNKNLKLAINTIKSGKRILKDNGFIEFETFNGKPSCYRIICEKSEDKKNIKKENLIVNSKIKKSIKKNIILEISEEKKSSIKTIELKQVDPVYQKNLKKEIPSLEEFLLFAKTLYNYSEEIKIKLEEKYKIWKKNDWNNNHNKPITNWKNTLKSTIPYLLEDQVNKDIFELDKIPNINRPNNQIITNKK